VIEGGALWDGEVTDEESFTIKGEFDKCRGIARETIPIMSILYLCAPLCTLLLSTF
jgi:hypothetical protein